MQSKLKDLFVASILLLIMISALASFVSPIFDSTTSTSNNTSLPALVRTLFTLLGWVPIVILSLVIILTVIDMITGGGVRRVATRYIRRRK